MTGARTLSAIVFFIVFLSGLFVPALWWIPPAIVIVGGVIGVWEFLHLALKSPPLAQTALAMAVGVALMVDGYLFFLSHTAMILGVGAITILGSCAFREDEDAAGLAAKTIAAPLYAALPLAFMMMFFRIVDGEWRRNGAYLILFLIIVTWSSDVGAYFVGRRFGKTKLAPKLSPGKTVEGSLGGIALTLITAMALKLLWPVMDRLFGWVDVFVLGLAFSIVGPIGDLAESRLKRSAGVKDSGRFLPGHGGMLDIIDSLLFTTIVYMIWFFIRYHGGPGGP